MRQTSAGAGTSRWSDSASARLSQNQFVLLVEARTIAEVWQKDYNEERPHDSLDGSTPAEFAERHTTMLNKLTVRDS